MKKILIATLLAVASIGAGKAATSTLGWNFTDLNGVFDTGTATDFTIGAFTIGNSLGTVSSPFSAVSVSSGYTGASGGGNLGNAVRLGAYSSSTSSYFSITITPATGYEISLTDFDFGTRSTATGAQAFALYSSVDSFGTAIFSGTIANNSSWALKNNSFSAFTFDSPTEFRLYTFGGTGSPAMGTINTRVDDVTISLSSTATAVPEPHEYAVAVAGLLIALIAMRRRKALNA